MADYTIVEGAGVSSTGASLSVPVPSGTLTGKLLLLVAAVRDYNGATVTTAPSGFTLLESYTPGSNPSLWIYGKIGTASESSVSFDTSTGVSQAAFMISVESTTGWPAIGSVEAGSSSGDYDGGSGNLGLIARTITTSGNFALQVGKKASVNGTNTVAVTSGWASAGRAVENGTSNTLNLAGQGKKVTANVPSVGVAITGEATSSVAGCITIELIPAVATGSWVATPANPYPGQTVSLALTGYAAAPLSANCSFGGVAITLEAGATNSAASFIMPARSAFRFGGGHAAKRFNVNYTLTIANATDTANANMQVVPQQAGGFGVRSAVAQSNTPMGDVINLGTWNSGAIVLATNDEVWGHIVSGSGVVNAPEVNYDAYSDPLVIDWTYYDISAGSWSGLTTTTYTEARTLTSADTTLTPGQTVRLTLSSAFSGAITAAKAVYGAVTIPITWAVVSSTLVDVTMPLLAECIASGSLVQLPWDTNFVLRLEASAESAETPSNNQMVAATPANYGTIGVGPWGVTPVGAQQGDKVYAELLIGTGSFVLATLTYTPTTPSVYRYYIFNVATQRWLDGYISGIAPKWAALRFAS